MPKQVLVLAENITFCVCGYSLWTRIRAAWLIVLGKDIGVPPMFVAGQLIGEVLEGSLMPDARATQGGANA